MLQKLTDITILSPTDAVDLRDTTKITEIFDSKAVSGLIIATLAFNLSIYYVESRG